jgi:hypothetical protein
MRYRLEKEIDYRTWLVDLNDYKKFCHVKRYNSNKTISLK